MLLSAVSVLVVAQSSSEFPEGLMNNPVYVCVYIYIYIYMHIGGGGIIFFSLTILEIT